MYVRVLRTGGFAGITQQAGVETELLEQAERDALVRLVQESEFFSLPANIETPEGGYDRFQYEITVEDGGQAHTVTCGDAGMNAALFELARFVLSLSRRTG
jgi:hypothetical protein